MVKRFDKIVLIAVFAVLLMHSFSLGAQEEVVINADENQEIAKTNYNQVYRYPLSVGVEVQFSSPIALLNTDYRGTFSTLDVSALTRIPIPPVPSLQPLIRLGLVTVKSQFDASDPNIDRYDHNSFYANLGLGYSHRFSKSLEVGVDLEGGAGISLFPKLGIADDDTYGAWFFQAAAAGRFTFSPAFNLALNVRPFLQYRRSLSPLERFNGFTFGVGLTADYRFGTDPDDPKAQIRSIEFSNPEVEDLFAAMQSYYLNNPMGEVTLTNVDKYPVLDMDVTFFQPGYMNIGTSVANIERLDPGESITIPLTAAFDKTVFNLEGVTPLTGEIGVEYTLRTRRASQTAPVTYDLYDKNSLTWDDDRKVAAFITSGDSALGNYIGFLKQASRDVQNPGFSEVMQTAMQVYYGLTEIGVLYQRDPTLAYEDAYGSTLVVDSVNLPRETLVKLAGDCDDLTVVFNGLLESAGIETGFVTVPGHIYSIFNTGLPAKDYRLINPDKNMTVALNGQLWIPLEITFIGEDGFDVAWRAGADEFYRYVDVDGALGLHYTREAQKVFRPVGFDEKDLGLQYGEQTKIVRDFSRSLRSATDRVIGSYEAIAREENSKGSWNKLGIVAAQFVDYDVAERAFFSALSLDRNYVPPKINLANVYFQKEQYQNALRLYHEAEERLREAGLTESATYSRLLLNISKTYREVENYDQSVRYSEKLSAINPDLADRYAYLADGAGARAADVSAVLDVLFVEE